MVRNDFSGVSIDNGHEKVQATQATRIVHSLGDLFDRKRRGVGCQNGRSFEPRFSVSKEGLFDLQLFSDRLDQ